MARGAVRAEHAAYVAARGRAVTRALFLEATALTLALSLRRGIGTIAEPGWLATRI